MWVLSLSPVILVEESLEEFNWLSPCESRLRVVFQALFSQTAPKSCILMAKWFFFSSPKEIFSFYFPPFPSRFFFSSTTKSVLFLSISFSSAKYFYALFCFSLQLNIFFPSISFWSLTDHLNLQTIRASRSIIGSEMPSTLGQIFTWVLLETERCFSQHFGTCIASNVMT